MDIEPFSGSRSWSPSRAVFACVNICDKVRPVASAIRTARDTSVSSGKGPSCLVLEDAGDLPSAKDRRGDAASRPLLTFAEGELDNWTYYQTVPHIEE